MNLLQIYHRMHCENSHGKLEAGKKKIKECQCRADTRLWNLGVLESKIMHPRNISTNTCRGVTVCQARAGGDTEMGPRRARSPPKYATGACSGVKKGFRSTLQSPAQPHIHHGNHGFHLREPGARRYSAARTVICSFLEHLLLPAP